MSPKPAARAGRLLVLEGLDGAGTTTQVQRIAAALRVQGRRVLTTREPSDGPIGQLIRQALVGRLGLPRGLGPLSEETLALLFAADRRDHIDAEVAPALARGEWVVCDRYLLSSLAYQGVPLSMDWVSELNARIPAPDLTLFLAVDFHTASQRRRKRGGSPELFEADARQKKVARAYEQAIRRLGRRERIVRLDGTAPVDEVTERALAEINQRF